MAGDVNCTGSKRLKILCLHGCRQNKEGFRQKLGSLRKGVSKFADMTFVEAPHTIIVPDSDSTDCRSWWFTSEDRGYVSKVPSDFELGFKESVNTIEKFVEKEGPFDGLMGFSQGACFAAIICSFIENDKFKGSFRFVILVSGFKSLCTPHKNFYDSVLSIPSLHVIGDTDNMIPKERSEDLSSMFANKEIFRHPGGHYVPGVRDAREHYQNFLSKFI